MTREAMWDFTLDDGSMLHVLGGTGHYSQVVNLDTGELQNRSVYNFQALRSLPDGEVRQTFVTRRTLQWLRRQHEAATERSGSDGAIERDAMMDADTGGVR